MVVNILLTITALSALALMEIGLGIQYAFTPRKRRLALCAAYEQAGAWLLLKLFEVARGFVIPVRNPHRIEIPPQCLVVANHQSLMDIIVLMRFLGGSRKPRFVAKQELRYGIPLVSFLLRKGGHSLIQRKGAAMDTMRAITDMALLCMQEGASPVIFPEGTRSRTGKLGPFHAAGVRRIQEVVSLPVVAIAIEGGWKIATLRGFLRNFGITPYTLELSGLYQAPHGKKEMVSVLEQARDAIATSIGQIRKDHGDATPV